MLGVDGVDMSMKQAERRQQKRKPLYGDTAFCPAAQRLNQDDTKRIIPASPSAKIALVLSTRVCTQARPPPPPPRAPVGPEGEPSAKANDETP
jgi:hypothetical protein